MARSDDPSPVLVAVGWLLVVGGGLWSALAGACNVVFESWAGRDLVQGALPGSAYSYKAGYALVTIVGSVPISAAGVGLGIICFRIGSGFLNNAEVRNRAPALIIGWLVVVLGLFWTVLAPFVLAAMLWRNKEHEILLAVSMAVFVLGPGIVMLWLGRGLLKTVRGRLG